MLLNGWGMKSSGQTKVHRVIRKEKLIMDIWKRKIVLYGNKKIQNDFRFLFGNLLIAENEKWDKSTIIKMIREDFLIVICEKERNCSFENVLKDMELQICKNYVYIEDFFQYYNPMFLERGNRKLAIWGTGETARGLWEILESRGAASEVDFFIDNAQNKSMFMGKKVFLPAEIMDKEDLYIIVATHLFQWEIYAQMEAYGLCEKKDYVHCDDVTRDYESLLRKVCFSDQTYAFRCDRPFGYCDVIGDELYLCCPDFLPISAGSMRSAPFTACWHSYMAKILRLSVLNGTYVFCNKQYCDLFDFDQETMARPEASPAYDCTCPEYPRTLMVGIDYSCNLRCPSCRTEICVASGEERKEMERKAEDLLEHVIPHVNRLWLAGSGEVFFSRVYRKILDDERCKKRANISILSNGTLFDEKRWKQLKESYKTIEIAISMDGMKDSTIEKLRRGSDAQELKRNLERLGDLRKKGEIDKLFLSCVLQDANVAELYELLEYCKEIGVDKVQFLKLKDNGTYMDADKFQSVSVFDEEGMVKEQYQPYFTEELRTHPLADWFNNSRVLHVEKRPRLDAYDTF